MFIFKLRSAKSGGMQEAIEWDSGFPYLVQPEFNLYVKETVLNMLDSKGKGYRS